MFANVRLLVRCAFVLMFVTCFMDFSCAEDIVPVQTVDVSKPSHSDAEAPTATLLDVNACKPRYSAASIQSHEQGTVSIKALVDVDDRLVAMQIMKSSGYRNLDAATVNAFGHCKFKTAYRDGKPIRSQLTINYEWKLPPPPPGAVGATPVETVDVAKSSRGDAEIPIATILDWNACQPEYSAESIQANEQGTIRIQAAIDVDDRLMMMLIEKSSGYRKLDEATIDALSRCKFKTASSDGKPVRSHMMIDYEWKLEPSDTDAVGTMPLITAETGKPYPSDAKAPAGVLTDLNNCKPKYPNASVQFNEQGTVRLQFVIDADDQLVSTQVIKSSGYRKLDKAAVDALSRCKFKAGHIDGKPIKSQATVDYDWTLDPPTPRTTIDYGGLPLEKKYADLSATEKMMVRSMYDNIPDADEPPYPLAGFAEIVEAIHDLQNMVLATGRLSLEVLIDPAGVPLSVSVYHSPDKSMTQYAAGILMNAKYKPGKCGGVPCQMPYRFDFNLAVSK